MSIRVLFVVAALLVSLAGCAGQEAQLAGGEPSTAGAAPTAKATDTDAAEVPTDTPEVTEAPVEPDPTKDATPEPDSDTPTLFSAGDVVTVTQNDDPYLDIVVSKISAKKSYGSGYFVDRPAKGNVYLQAYVTYSALADGATYNPFDWQVFCNDEAVDDYAFVTEGPKPTLNSGTLPKGRKAKGWLVYEVPAKGRCVLSYGANSFNGTGAVFEVLLRSK